MSARAPIDPVALRRVVEDSGAELRCFADEEQACGFARRRCAEAPAPDDEPGFVAASWVRARALITRTGSVGLATRDLASRRSSLCCLHLYLVIDAAQSWPDLGSYLASLDGARLAQEVGSSLVWVTGPSRTADIEKVLVTPAHGPARVTLCLFGASR